jgi:deoxyribonuclease V
MRDKGKASVSGSLLKKLKDEQLKESHHVIEDDVEKEMELVAGVDVAYKDLVAYGAAVLLDSELKIIETATSRTPVEFPYISGFLSYRELNPALKAIKGLKGFDVLMVNGHGIAHPRGFGLASHLGVIIKKPTIGVAKNILVGESALTNGEAIIFNGRKIGEKITSPTGAPVYVSVGHMISLKRAVNLVKAYFTCNRMPEPLTQAHILAQKQGKN